MEEEMLGRLVCQLQAASLVLQLFLYPQLLCYIDMLCFYSYNLDMHGHCAIQLKY